MARRAVIINQPTRSNLGTAYDTVTTGTEGSTLCYLLTNTQILRYGRCTATAVNVSVQSSRGTLAGTVGCIEVGKSWCEKDWNC